ncbi:MAG: NUDIX domain-containing protein [Nitrososphaerales archaeon]|nr:NUDIX domain-containing protein [Nitrososphaerales archaeon]
MPEYFDVVDEEDNVIDRRPGRECVKEGLLHRAIAAFLFDSKGEVYLQRRADSMLWYPGSWTISCTGHVSSGETYTKAARREVKEELGLDCELTSLGKVLSPKWKYRGIVEWEYLCIFESVVSDPITLSDETKEGMFLPFPEFKRRVSEDPFSFTPDTILAFEHYSKAKGTR